MSYTKKENEIVYVMGLLLRELLTNPKIPDETEFPNEMQEKIRDVIIDKLHHVIRAY